MQVNMRRIVLAATTLAAREYLSGHHSTHMHFDADCLHLVAATLECVRVCALLRAWRRQTYCLIMSLLTGSLRAIPCRYGGTRSPSRADARHAPRARTTRTLWSQRPPVSPHASVLLKHCRRRRRVTVRGVTVL